MGLAIDWFNQIIQVTSPTTAVDAQTLHDFIEDSMASPEGLLYGEILDPQGKIEDPNNPGVFSQIILPFNSPWQIQFWGGSGYTRVFGGKLTGGLGGQVIKATGTAGDITVLESPVDGVTVATPSADAAIAAAVWQYLIEGGKAAEWMLRILVAEAMNNGTVPPGDGNFDFKSLDGLKTRLAGTIASGVRTVTTKDGDP